MWTSHHITIDADTPVPSGKEKFALIRRAVRAALAAEGVEIPCEVNVHITGNPGMRDINLAQRQIDAPTDVLSFPMLPLKPGKPLDHRAWADPGSGLTVLGDMVLNLDRMQAQAAEYGHSQKRELSYLVVHSVLHLLGYDHLDEGPQKARMRAREEAVMKQLKIPREG